MNRVRLAGRRKCLSRVVAHSPVLAAREGRRDLRKDGEKMSENASDFGKRIRKNLIAEISEQRNIPHFLSSGRNTGGVTSLPKPGPDDRVWPALPGARHDEMLFISAWGHCTRLFIATAPETVSFVHYTDPKCLKNVPADQLEYLNATMVDVHSKAISIKTKEAAEWLRRNGYSEPPDIKLALARNCELRELTQTWVPVIRRMFTGRLPACETPFEYELGSRFHLAVNSGAFREDAFDKPRQVLSKIPTGTKYPDNEIPVGKALTDAIKCRGFAVEKSSPDAFAKSVANGIARIIAQDDGMKPKDPETISVAEAAKELGIDPGNVSRWVDEGKLEALNGKRGKGMRIIADSVKRHVPTTRKSTSKPRSREWSCQKCGDEVFAVNKPERCKSCSSNAMEEIRKPKRRGKR